ncbi:MAG: pyridoxamine 5'-phosphate oxidase, partial [Actinobacteria bacterium]|nr:pyridoxamine 5'-phosphate oxidase [Actinomycetota bacterium]
SKRLDSRETLQIAYSELASKYPEGAKVPTPPNWGGYLIAPTNIEFWQGRYSRLHDRVRYVRTHDNAAKTQWKLERFYP